MTTIFRNALRVLPALHVLLLSCQFARAAAPGIEFTYVPAFGSFDNLQGRALNVSAQDYKVAVFIFIPGAGWYTKPTCAAPLTTIQSDSSWTADITTGGSDEKATKIAAYLVPVTFTQPCVLGP